MSNCDVAQTSICVIIFRTIALSKKPNPASVQRWATWEKFWSNLLLDEAMPEQIFKTPNSYSGFCTFLTLWHQVFFPSVANFFSIQLRFAYCCIIRSDDETEQTLTLSLHWKNCCGMGEGKVRWGEERRGEITSQTRCFGFPLLLVKEAVFFQFVPHSA